MSQDLAVARSAMKLGFFVSSLTLASLGARLATADISPAGESRAFGLAAARAVNGDLSDRALYRSFGSEGSPLFARHDPRGTAPTAVDLLRGYEQGAPHPLIGPALAAPAALVAAPTPAPVGPPARPFVFRGGAADRAAALTCLTQAVYYEAGFEPLAGAQAVAQVVLNRVRHPIFPKSICGVVYQGAELKTGCQFSFTCDGSLSKSPAPGAWARARSVAEKAMAGYVQKEVGEATHYHTRFVNPWWAPTVTRIAEVGVQIFYRWPGALGAPAAFVGRYAGGEHVGRGRLIASAQQPGDATGDRVHMTFASASTASASPAIMSRAEAMASMELASARTTTPAIAPSPIAPSPIARSPIAKAPGVSSADDGEASRR